MATPARFGIVDMGSNAIRFLIAEADESGAATILESRRIAVRNSFLAKRIGAKLKEIVVTPALREDVRRIETHGKAKRNCGSHGRAPS